MFTSDVLKRLRKDQGISQPLDGRPSLAPKPRNSRLRAFNSTKSLFKAESARSGFDIFHTSGSLFSDIGSQTDLVATTSFNSSTPMKPAKSTPSLLLDQQMSPVTCHAKTVVGSCQSTGGSFKSDIEDARKWRNNTDYMELMAPDELSDSPGGKSPTAKTTSPSSSFSAPSSKTSSLGSSSSARLLRHMSTSATVSTSANHHAHSNSDSGLSSLSGGCARTNTMSPVSTLSTLSSISSASSNGSAGSSRASIRSTSFLSTSSVPEQTTVPALQPLSAKVSSSTLTSEVIPAESLPSESGGCGDSGTGTMRRKVQRMKFQEEIDCEELSQELAKELSPSKRIQDLFVVYPTHKTPSDYIDGILELDLKNGTQVQRKHLSPSLLRQKIEELKISENRLVTPAKSSEMRLEQSSEKSNGCKSKIKDHHVEDQGFNIELHNKKEELCRRIGQKLDVLKAEELALSEEIVLNEQLGQEVAAKVKESPAKPNEVLKFELHVEEIERITSLLLGLSGRLARTENSLNLLSEGSSPEEKKSLEAKKRKLMEQLNEAKRLKESIDRRSSAVSQFLRKYLGDDDYADYDHFVKMKSKLIMDSKEINDKVKLGEEQMQALKDSMSCRIKY